MKSFEVIPHTADLRLKVSGDTLDELFRAAVEGMAAIQNPRASESKLKNKNEEVKIKAEVKSADLTSLLIDFLSEILTQSNINKAVFVEVNFEKLTEMELTAEVKGTKVDEFDEDIKAVTYHEANVVQKEKGQWETIIIFDI